MNQSKAGIRSENAHRSNAQAAARSNMAAEPTLVIVEGPNKGETMRLGNGEVIIGRNAPGGLCLADESVSRKQCSITHQGNSYVLVDFNSHNGSFVNGVATRKRVLQHGDRIRLGATEMVFVEQRDENSSRESQRSEVTRNETPASRVNATREARSEQSLERRSINADSAVRAQGREVNLPARVVAGPRQAIVRPVVAAPLVTATPVQRGSRVERARKMLSRRTGIILAFLALGIVAAVAVQFLAPRIYESTALVRVEGHSASLVGQAGSELVSVDDMNKIMATEMEVVHTDAVLRPVAERFDLLSAESQLKGLSAEQVRQKREAAVQLDQLRVTRQPDSYMLKISYRAHDPQLGANVANAVADSLIENANESARRSFDQIATVVAQDMPDLASKMESSASTFAEFEKQLNMVDPAQRVTVLTARLQQLNAQLATVQAERTRRESVMGQVANSNTLAAAQAAAQDSLLTQAIERLNTARQQFANARSYYGERHPEYAKAQKQVQEVEAQVRELQANTKDRAQADYRQVLGQEARLNGLVQQTKAELDKLGANATEYEHLKSEANSDKNAYQQLTNQARAEAVRQRIRNVTLQIAAPALPAQEPVFPRLPINLAVAMLGSSILGIITTVFANAMDKTITDPRNVAGKFHVNVLGSIPEAKLLQSSSSKRLKGAGLRVAQLSAETAAQFEEGLRALRASLMLTAMNQPVRNVVVTSALPGEGKSVIAANLAAACAQAGQRVLLIDSNLRRPKLHNIFGVASMTGLSEVLKGQSPYQNAIVRLPQANLFLMPAGQVSKRAADLIGVALPTVLADVSPMFDLVIVDAPAVLGAAESLQIAAASDGVLLLAKANATAEKSVLEAMSSLAGARANVLGLVMNQAQQASVPKNAAYSYPEATGMYNAHRLHA